MEISIKIKTSVCPSFVTTLFSFIFFSSLCADVKKSLIGIGLVQKDDRTGVYSIADKGMTYESLVVTLVYFSLGQSMSEGLYLDENGK